MDRRDASFRPVEVLTCDAALQGRIAYDYEGNAGWAPEIMADLCQSVPDDEPAFCFERVLFGELDWGGGTVWGWEPAIALCGGAADATPRIACFQQQIAAGTPWEQAIPACAGPGAGGSLVAAAPQALPSEAPTSGAPAAQLGAAGRDTAVTQPGAAAPATTASGGRETIEGDVRASFSGSEFPVPDVPDPAALLRDQPGISPVAIVCASHGRGWHWSGSYGVTAQEAQDQAFAACAETTRGYSEDGYEPAAPCTLHASAERLVEADGAFGGAMLVEQQTAATSGTDAGDGLGVSYPGDPEATVCEGVAMQVGADRLDLYPIPDLRIYVNGKRVTFSGEPIALAGGGSVSPDGSTLYVRWPGEAVELSVEVVEGYGLGLGLEASEETGSGAASAPGRATIRTRALSHATASGSRATPPPRTSPGSRKAGAWTRQPPS